MQPENPEVARLQREVLWSLTNEDHLGLWEIAWMLDVSPGQDRATIDSKVSLARVAAWDLLQRDAIEVWELDGWPPAEARRMTLDEFHNAAGEPAVWTDPEAATRLIQVRASAS